MKMRLNKLNLAYTMEERHYRTNNKKQKNSSRKTKTMHYNTKMRQSKPVIMRNEKKALQTKHFIIHQDDTLKIKNKHSFPN